jgi:hypothetical protein
LALSLVNGNISYIFVVGLLVNPGDTVTVLVAESYFTIFLVSFPFVVGIEIGDKLPGNRIKLPT